MRTKLFIPALPFIFSAIVTSCGGTQDQAYLDATSGKAVHFPKKLVCSYDGQKNKGKKDVLYTRLNGVTQTAQLTDTEQSVWRAKGPSKPQRDEVAYGWASDYYDAFVSTSSYRYAVWTCDTEDRNYVFKTSDLAAVGTQKTKIVKGTVEISVREDSKTYQLTCDAIY